MIKLQVIGHLGKDATVNNVSGKKVINFTVAHSENWTDAQGNQKDKTIWVDCAYWTDRTGIAPYLKKGTQVYAEGTPEVKTYAKNDGTTGSSLVLRTISVQLLGGGQSNPASNNSAPVAATGTPANSATGSGAEIDTLPF